MPSKATISVGEKFLYTLKAGPAGGLPAALRPGSDTMVTEYRPHPPRRREPAQGIAVLDVGRAPLAVPFLAVFRRAGWR
jgi:hypothetical protein